MTRVAQELPKIGLVMEEVKVIRWLKSVGDQVVAGEPLLEVETEKSLVEIEAAATGLLTEILVQADSHAAVGDRIAWIDSAEAHAAAAAPLGKHSPIAAAGVPARTPDVASTTHNGERIHSTPVARKLAAERGIDIRNIPGTGPGRRVQLDDVRRAAGAPSLAPMRRAVARAMSLSNATVPQFTVSRSVEWTSLRALSGELSARWPSDAPKLSLTDFLLQAVAGTLMEFPALNATFLGEVDSAGARIAAADGAHIGLVVAVEDGLLVPVIHDVDRLGLQDIARRRRDCVERSLKGRLRREDTEGATFSISNLGAEGPDRFTALVNPPQSAILAVGRRRDDVVAREGAVVVRPVSDLTMTVDHRVADGRLAAQFLARLVRTLEGRDWRLE